MKKIVISLIVLGLGGIFFFAPIVPQTRTNYLPCIMECEGLNFPNPYYKVTPFYFVKIKLGMVNQLH